ncbi:MAG: endonuclease/exonuclease/phosphatase family protein [Oligoflexus sp.]
MQRLKNCVTLFSALWLSLLSFACVESPTPRSDDEMILNTEGRFQHSTMASNLLTTAIQKELDVDIVFYPSEALNEQAYAIVEKGMEDNLVDRRLLGLYAGDSWSSIAVGTLRGSDIRNFLVNRTMETGRHDVHTAGIHYYVRLEGGLPAIYHVKMADGSELNDSRSYRVAVSKNALDGQFPGYKFRHNFNFGFQYEKDQIHNTETVLKSYVKRIRSFASYNELRSSVEITDRGVVPGILPIYEVQGISHISPYLAKRITIQGVVTAAGSDPNQGVFEFYLQSEEPSPDPRASEAILVRMTESSRRIKVGTKLEVSGVVYEEMTKDGLTRTALGEVDRFEVLATEQRLPAAIVLGEGEEELEGRFRSIPDQKISTHRGNLNQKDSLNLQDGLDFWESLEGMRVVLRRPRVVGLSGGQKDAQQVKRYLNLFVVASGTETKERVTPKGGMIPEPDKDLYNPQIIKIVDHQFSKIVDPTYSFEVGDRFDYDLEGIMAFELNPFGNGEYVFYVMNRFTPGSKIKTLAERPITKLASVPGKLTVATFNVENLSALDLVGGNQGRMVEVGKAITTNLLCPDIINLVEAQDGNGKQFDGYEVSIDRTLSSLISQVKDCPHAVDYRYVNINPIENQEGGEPGGNIRVAMLYNALRVDFEPRGDAGALEESFLRPDGSLNVNPGRIFPNDAIFARTRRSLIVEFLFEGERVFVVGNHLNSKLGDTSLWDAQQPPVFGSEVRRSQMARRLNDYVKLMLRTEPNANIVVVGDFNDFDVSNALRVLEGRELKNLMHVLGENGQPLVAPQDRYTYNFGGNSQPIDFILASYPLLQRRPEVEVLHINTDYMAQIADHDPVIARFDFQHR